MKEALLVVDMQKLFHEGKARGLMDRAAARIVAELGEFRRNSEPVIWIQHRRMRGSLRPGNAEFDIIDSLDPRETEARITKTRPNAFVRTGLGAELDRLGVDTLRICGYKAEACVLFTYLGASRKGYSASIVKDGIASDTKLGVRIGRSIYGKREGSSSMTYPSFARATAWRGVLAALRARSRQG